MTQCGKTAPVSGPLQAKLTGSWTPVRYVGHGLA